MQDGPQSHSSQYAIFQTENPLQIRQMIIGERVPAKRAIAEIGSRFSAQPGDLALLLDVSARTIARRSKSATDHLTASQADRAYRLARLFDLAVEMLGNRDKAIQWFHERLPALGNERAIDLIRTEIGAQQIERSLYAIGYGGLA